MFEKMFDLSNPYFKEMMIMFVINMFFQFILIRLVYYRYSRKDSYLFAFFLVGLIVFFIGCLLNYIQIQMQLAVGLVAIFTILRLRTLSITIKEMAYTFAVIGISVINSLHFVAFPLLGRLIVNCIIILMALILEAFLVRNKSKATELKSYKIIYENIDLLKPDKRNDLLSDLSLLTGKEIIKFKINEVDYKKRLSELVIYYNEKNPV